jgi:ABC-type transport system involved in Fe-S cluster assembly fused permease/ATPase subunit
MNSIQRVIFSCGLVVSLLLGVSEVMAGSLTAGDIVLLQSLMMQLFQPLFFLGVMHRNWTESIIDIRGLFKILEKKSKYYDKINIYSIVESPSAVDFVYKGGGIQFRETTFAYSDKSTDIFKNLNFEIDKGDWVTIVGQSGIGKSTLFNLIVLLIFNLSSDYLTQPKEAYSWTAKI